MHGTKIKPAIGARARRRIPGVATGIALVLALATRRAGAEENAAPVPPPPKAAAATAPSPKAADAPKGTKASPAEAAQPPPPPAEAPSAAPPPADAAPSGAAGAPAAATPPAAPPKVEGGPPPVYFVEPSGGEPASVPPPGSPPPLPPPTAIYEPPLPPEPSNRVPETAFWIGARVSWFVPMGSLWIDTFDSRAGLYYRRRLFEDYASSGPGLEFDVGVRLARRYNVFALMEHSFLGSGSLDDHAYGGQSRGRTSLYGGGIRFSSEPASLGFLLELALGYREFRASWSDGSELSLTGGWVDARIGLGADVRVNKYFSLSPMLVFGGGTFGQARWSGPGSGDRDALDHQDALGQYTTFSAQLGGHFDVY